MGTVISYQVDDPSHLVSPFDDAQPNQHEVNAKSNVASPLRAPYRPNDSRLNSSLQGSKKQGKNGPISRFWSMHMLFKPMIFQRNNRAITGNTLETANGKWAHSVLHNQMAESRFISPVSLTASRTLAPLKVGTGVVLTKVVEELERNPDNAQLGRKLDLPCATNPQCSIPTPCESFNTSLVSKLEVPVIHSKSVSDEKDMVLKNPNET